MFHTLDICRSLAEKLSSSSEVLESIRNQKSSLLTGGAGIALFYSVLSRYFPEERYEYVADEYLISSLPEYSKMGSISLLQGIAGLCFTVYTCSKEGSRYSKLLTKLDQLLIDRLTLFLQKEDKEIEDCNVSNGMSGVLSYLLLRQNNPLLLRYARECLLALIEFTKQKKIVSGYAVPSWHKESDSSNGKFLLTSIDGVAGILSALSLSSLEGMKMDGLETAILSLAEWLETKRRNLADGPAWPFVIFFEEEIGNAHSEDLSQICYFNSLSIVRSLYLGYKATNRQASKQCAEEMFVKTLLRFSPFSEKLAPSIAFGKASLLAVALRMYQDTKNFRLPPLIYQLEEKLKNSFHPAYAYGFQTKDFSTGKPLDEPGILDGAAGIGLTLLLAEGKHDLNWDRMFLLR